MSSVNGVREGLHCSYVEETSHMTENCMDKKATHPLIYFSVLLCRTVSMCLFSFCSAYRHYTGIVFKQPRSRVCTPWLYICITRQHTLCIYGSLNNTYVSLDQKCNS